MFIEDWTPPLFFTKKQFLFWACGDTGKIDVALFFWHWLKEYILNVDKTPMPTLVIE